MNQNFKNKNRYRRNHGHHQKAQSNSMTSQPGVQNSAEKVVVRYDQLQEAHIQARKKYYDFYYRADPQQLDKFERSFDRTLVELREFESRLGPQDYQILKSKRDNYHLDLTYSTNHQLDPEKYPMDSDLKIEDPHTLESQIKCDFSNDKEESYGNADDYKKYKGIE